MILSSIKLNGVLIGAALALGLVACSSGAKNESTQKSGSAESSQAAGSSSASDQAASVASETDKAATKQMGEKGQPGEKKKMKADSSSTAGTAVGTVAGTIECVANEDKRVITVADKNPGCEVIYEKAGASSSVASAQHDMSYCTQVQEKMKAKFEAAGFTCK